MYIACWAAAALRARNGRAFQREVLELAAHAVRPAGGAPAGGHLASGGRHADSTDLSVRFGGGRPRRHGRWLAALRAPDDVETPKRRRWVQLRATDWDRDERVSDAVLCCCAGARGFLA